LLVEGRTFPTVALGPGNWRVDVEEQVDSVLHITSYTLVTKPEGKYWMPSVVEIRGGRVEKVYIFGPANVSAVIVSSGKEPHINVYASAVKEVA
jgi:hypothetical protein